MVAVWSHAFQRTHFVIAQQARCNQEYLTGMVEILLMPKGRTTSWRRSNTNHWKLWSVAIQIGNMSHYKVTGNFVLLSSGSFQFDWLKFRDCILSTEKRLVCLIWPSGRVFSSCVGQPTLSCFWTLQRKLLPVGFVRDCTTPSHSNTGLGHCKTPQALLGAGRKETGGGCARWWFHHVLPMPIRKMCWTSLRDFWKRSGSPSCCISEFATLSPTCQWGLLDFMSAIPPSPPPPPPDLNCKT
jgi:hypothetical protein